MDWINCNACFIQPGNGRKFHLTSCGHIYCDGCVYESKFIFSLLRVKVY